MARWNAVMPITGTSFCHVHRSPCPFLDVAVPIHVATLAIGEGGRTMDGNFIEHLDDGTSQSFTCLLLLLLLVIASARPRLRPQLCSFSHHPMEDAAKGSVIPIYRREGGREGGERVKRSTGTGNCSTATALGPATCFSHAASASAAAAAVPDSRANTAGVASSLSSGHPNSTSCSIFRACCSASRLVLALMATTSASYAASVPRPSPRKYSRNSDTPIALSSPGCLNLPASASASSAKYRPSSSTIPAATISSTRRSSCSASAAASTSTHRKQHRYRSAPASFLVVRRGHPAANGLCRGSYLPAMAACMKELDPPATTGIRPRPAIPAMARAAITRNPAGSSSPAAGSSSPSKWCGTPQRSPSGILLVVMSRPRYT
ncbi:hypothetical protein C4D60_Mb04t06480 [Musa balbisiana]|uniref:Uncharacterized protein n=1 Tax=Musa balbisiana TaxID=52838 RepID=A0A4S8KA70_MUSBA|nr:hypothetical protein C4D60_Mb04t06480 [Musa balbisiana]